MPVAVHICPDHMTRADYENLTAELKASGVHEPAGRLGALGDSHMDRERDRGDHRRAHEDQLRPFHRRLLHPQFEFTHSTFSEVDSETSTPEPVATAQNETVGQEICPKEYPGDGATSSVQCPAGGSVVT